VEAPEAEVVVSANHSPQTGRFVKGNTANTRGREKGRPNNATIAKRAAAQKVLEREGARAAQLVVRLLDDPNQWAALAAARIVLEHALPAGQESPDMEWVEYATEKEIRTVHRIIERCRRRMVPSEGPIDVTPEPSADSFSLASLPASGNAAPEPEPQPEAQPAPDDEWEEF
jgi:hypothetical protein